MNESRRKGEGVSTGRRGGGKKEGEWKKALLAWIQVSLLRRWIMVELEPGKPQGIGRKKGGKFIYRGEKRKEKRKRKGILVFEEYFQPLTFT